MNATLGQIKWRKSFPWAKISKITPNALLASQSFMMQKVGVTQRQDTNDLFYQPIFSS
jgi:hypothetical protein